MKMKIISTKKTILTTIIAIAFLSVIPIFQSCSNSDNDIIPVQQSKQLEYLDMDVSNLQDVTEEQKLIFEKAKARIDSFVVLKDNKFKLTINCGSKIQISERLFNYFQETIKQTNLVIKDLNVVQRNSKVLHVIKKTSGNVRFKANANPENIPVNRTDYEITWSGVDIYISSHTLNGIALESGSIAAISAMLPEPIVSKASAGILALTAGLAAYTAAEYPNGIVVHISWGGLNSYSAQ